jgi:uncharacterized membrane protein YukC
MITRTRTGISKGIGCAIITIVIPFVIIFVSYLVQKGF